MAVLDLHTRLTDDYDEYSQNTNSSSSKIHIKGTTIIDGSGQECMKLSVGETWFYNNKYIGIPDKGIKVKPRESVVVVSEQKISLPSNVFGIVFGVGKNIFKGGFVANGKGGVNNTASHRRARIIEGSD